MKPRLLIQNTGTHTPNPVPAQWVLLAVHLITHHFFIELVQAHDAATLLAITRCNILPGTMIWSNQWVTYCTLNNARYVHQMVIVESLHPVCDHTDQRPH